MPTPAAKPAEQTGGRKPARSIPARAQAGAIKLGRSNDGWTYLANPMALQCLHGHIVPMLSKSYDTPGLNGNGRDKTGNGAIARMATEGYKAVPHDFECVAWGEQRAGEISNYLDRYEERDPDGKVVHVWHQEPWIRLRMLGHMMVRDFDAEGWLDFHQRVMAWLCPEGLDPAQIDVATRDLFRQIRDTARRDDARARDRLGRLLIHVPRKHATRDILALMEADKKAT